MSKELTYLFSVLLLFILSNTASAQRSFVADSSKIKMNIKTGEKTASSKPDSSIVYSEKAIAILENCKVPLMEKEFLSYSKLKSTAYNNIGFALKNKGDFQASMQYFRKSLEIVEKIKYEEGIVAVRLNMAIVYRNLGDLNKAIEENFVALKIAEKFKQERNMANIYNNLGLIYFSQSDYDRAIDYYYKSAELKEKLGLKSLQGITYSNIGLAYKTQKNYDKALLYYNKAKEVSSNEDKLGKALVLGNIAVLYTVLYEQDSLQKAKVLYCLDSAEFYLNLSYKIQQESGDKKGLILSLCNLATVYSYKNNLQRALDSAKVAYEMANKMSSPESIRNVAYALKNIYNRRGEPEKAYNMYLEFKNARDSVSNENKRKASEKQQLKYEWENKEARLKAEQDKKNLLFESTIALSTLKHKNQEEKRTLEAEQERERILQVEKMKRLKEEQIHRERKVLATYERQQKKKAEEYEEKQLKQVLYAALVGGFVLLVFIYVIYKRFKQTKAKQKIIIEQRAELSIAYYKLHEHINELVI